LLFEVVFDRELRGVKTKPKHSGRQLKALRPDNHPVPSELRQIFSPKEAKIKQDILHMVEANRGSISDYFKLIEALREENSLALWEQIIATLSSIDFLYLGNDERSAFQAYGRGLLKPVFDRIGWEPKRGEQVADGLLRTKLISELSELRDEDVIAGAREHFRKFVADPNALPPDLRPGVLDVVGRHADQKTWDKLHELGLKTLSIEEKANFYDAMAAALSPELAKRTLPLSLTEELPASQSVFLVMEVARAGEQPEIAWDFAQANREKLDAKLGAYLAARFVPYVMRGFSEARYRARDLRTKVHARWRKVRQ
jgi:aminopeptidase N